METPERISKKHQGPFFPYRFSFDAFSLYTGGKPADVPLCHSFVRWTTGTSHQKSLEWNDQGKGKGVTTLSSDDPPRCCSEHTPQLFLRVCFDDVAGITSPGNVYLGYVAGSGWYSANPGTGFLIRLVTNKDEIPLLRDEALLYEAEMLRHSHEPHHGQDTLEPLEFHGFFQTDARDAAAIVLEYRGPSIEDGNNKKLRKKRGKKRHCKHCNHLLNTC